MDLTKMSVPSLLAMCDECNYPGIADELARRLAAAEAALDNTVRAIDSALGDVPPCDGNDGSFFMCHFDADGNEIGTEQVDPAQVVQWLVNGLHEARKVAAQHPNGGRDE